MIFVGVNLRLNLGQTLLKMSLPDLKLEDAALHPISICLQAVSDLAPTSVTCNVVADDESRHANTSYC